MNLSSGLILTSALALSGPATVYRVPVRGETLQPAQRTAMQTRIDRMMQESTVSVLRSDPAATCTDDDCWHEQARRVDARFVLTLDIDRHDADHDLVVRIVDTTDGATVLNETRTCELCGRDELEDAASDVVARGLRQLSTLADASLSVDSVPAGAMVRIDGNDVGTTPVELDVESGRHTIEVSAPGYDTSVETLEIERGTREGLRLHLARSTQPERPDVAPRRGRLWLGGGLLGGGVVTMGVGAALVVLHGRPITSDCSGDNVDGDGDCQYLHDTRGGGIAALSVGAAAAVAGAVLLGLELRSRSRASVAISPTPSGMLLHGRF